MSLFLAWPALAQNLPPTVAAQAVSVSDLTNRYPAGSIQSVELADEALEKTAQARTHIDAQFAQEERACYPVFFMTACLQQAKERRRQAISQVRRIEVEANHFKRAARAAKRDQALAEKAAVEREGGDAAAGARQSSPEKCVADC